MLLFVVQFTEDSQTFFNASSFLDLPDLTGLLIVKIGNRIKFVAI